MIDYIAYTTFKDIGMTEVNKVFHLHGKQARTVLDIIARNIGRTPIEGDTWNGARVDRVGSEMQLAA